MPAFRLAPGPRVASAVRTRRLDRRWWAANGALALLRAGVRRAKAPTRVSCSRCSASAGVGKSRLVEEFLVELDGEPRSSAAGACRTATASRTSRCVEAIKEAAGLADFDLPDVVESKVCAVLEGDEHAGASSAAHVVAADGRRRGRRAGEETFWAIRRFFEASARRAAARARVRRHPLGRADVPRPGRAHRRLVARRPDPAPVHGAARPARRAPGVGRRQD